MGELFLDYAGASSCIAIFHLFFPFVSHNQYFTLYRLKNEFYGYCLVHKIKYVHVYSVRCCVKNH